MKHIGNSVPDCVRVTREWVDCDRCQGNGSIPKDPYDLDCEIEITCPVCGGKGGAEEEVWH